MSEIILQGEKLQRFFGGVHAIDQLDFIVPARKIKSIIGPNGAGKTTLFNLITGIIPPTSGTLKFAGKILNGLKPQIIASLGIGRTFQNLELFGNMTALENVIISRHRQAHCGILSTGLRLPKMRQEEKEIRERALKELHFMSLEDKADFLASALPLGEQRLLEIARALATEPRLLLLDEPAAGLNIRETAQLAKTIFRICARGITVLLVEHDMSLVMEVSDEVLVLNYGRKIAEGPPREIQRHPEVIAAYLGEEA